MKRDNGEDEDQRQDEDNDGVDLQAGRLVRVELCVDDELRVSIGPAKQSKAKLPPIDK